MMANIRGLFWLSKDLFEEEFQASTVPNARALDRLRNYFEHRYVQVHEDSDWNMAVQARADEIEFHYPISRRELAARTSHLLRISRAALIYLSLAVNREQRKRSIASAKVSLFRSR